MPGCSDRVSCDTLNAGVCSRLAQQALEAQRAAAGAALNRAADAEQREEELRTGGAAAPTTSVLKSELDAAVRAVGEQRARAEAAIRRAQLAEDELAFVNAIQGPSLGTATQGVPIGGSCSGQRRSQSAVSRSRSELLPVYTQEHEPMPIVAERSASAPETDISQLVAEVRSPPAEPILTST